MLLLGLIAFGVTFVMKDKLNAARPELVWHKVKYERLSLTIVERGSLESSKNSDILCKVKAGNKGGTIASQIKYVIDDGSAVRGPTETTDVSMVLGSFYSAVRPHHNDGQLIVELDSSGLEEQLKTQQIVLDKARSEKIQAQQQLKITLILNESNIKTAATNVELAAIDLSKYTGIEVAELIKPATSIYRVPAAMVASVPLLLDEVLQPVLIEKLRQELLASTRNSTRSARQIAEEDLKKYKTGEYLQELKDDLGQIETAQSDVTQQEDREAWAFRMAKKGYQTQSQAQSEKSRTDSYTLALNKVTLQLDVLVKYKKIRLLTQYVTALEEAQRSLTRIIAQSEALKVRDETDEQTKERIYEQELAHYRDIEDEIKKCKIYAPQDGMVVYYIPEQARFGSGSQQSIVAQGEPVREGQKLMQIPDLRHMVVVTKVHEALVSQVHPGQKATLRIYSFGGRILHGEVESVATVAAQTDWMSADVKVYNTRIKIDDKDTEGADLKPGMSAEVTITVKEALDHPVLTVPVQAVIGGNEMGKERKVIVLTPEGPKERAIVTGLNNDRYVEVKSGLSEGDEVLENPKAFVGDKVKTRDAPPEKGGRSPGAGGGPGASPGAGAGGDGERKGKGSRGKTKGE